MDLYHVALYVHIITLVVAGGLTAVVKLAISRRIRARTVGEVLDWHNVLTSTAKIFPICLASFVLTGFYMLSISRLAILSTGFVVAGIVGVVLLFASGTFLGITGNSLRVMLEGMAQKGADQPAPKLVPPPLVAALPHVNTFLALGVAFDMTTKPTSIPVALSVLAIAIVLGAAVGMRRPAPAKQMRTA